MARNSGRKARNAPKTVGRSDMRLAGALVSLAAPGRAQPPVATRLGRSDESRTPDIGFTVLPVSSGFFGNLTLDRVRTQTCPLF